MNKRILCLSAMAALVVVGSVWLSTETQAIPCPPGWTCECTTSTPEVRNVQCINGEGEEGTIVVTVCQECPPPDCNPQGNCYLSPCEFDIAVTCQ